MWEIQFHRCEVILPLWMNRSCYIQSRKYYHKCNIITKNSHNLMFTWLPASLHSNHPVSWYISTFALIRNLSFSFWGWDIPCFAVISATLIHIRFQRFISVDWINHPPSNYEEMMTDLKSIKLSSFTFDITLSIVF